jgi:hypothetical protein
MAKKKKGPKTTPRKAPPTSIALPGRTWSFDLPVELKIAIADAVTIFSRIDHMIVECIWILEQADLKRKKQIAKEHAHENIKYVRGVVEGHMKLDIGPTWDALAELRQERNLIAHGVWSMRFGGDTPGEIATPPTGIPMVLWHSKMIESDDFVTAESFDYWKFERFMKRATLLFDTFMKFRYMAEDAINAEKLSLSASLDDRPHIGALTKASHGYSFHVSPQGRMLLRDQAAKDSRTVLGAVLRDIHILRDEHLADMSRKLDIGPAELSAYDSDRKVPPLCFASRVASAYGLNRIQQQKLEEAIAPTRAIPGVAGG